MPRGAKAMREYRKRKEGEGFCTRCFKNKPSEGRKLCTECVTSLNNARDTARKSSFRCRDCLVKINTNSSRCEKCSELQNGRMLKLRDQRRSEGLCIKCGVPVDGGYSVCTNCQMQNSESRALRNSLKV